MVLTSKRHTLHTHKKKNNKRKLLPAKQQSRKPKPSHASNNRVALLTPSLGFVLGSGSLKTFIFMVLKNLVFNNLKDTLSIYTHHFTIHSTSNVLFFFFITSFIIHPFRWERERERRHFLMRKSPHHQTNNNFFREMFCYI